MSCCAGCRTWTWRGRSVPPARRCRCRRAGRCCCSAGSLDCSCWSWSDCSSRCRWWTGRSSGMTCRSALTGSHPASCELSSWQTETPPPPPSWRSLTWCPGLARTRLTAGRWAATESHCPGRRPPLLPPPAPPQTAESVSSPSYVSCHSQTITFSSNQISKY